MRKGCRSKIHRLIAIFCLAIALACLPVLIQKGSRISNKVSQLAEVSRHYINWTLNQGTPVATEANLLSQPLPKFRLKAMHGPLRVSSINPRYFIDANGKAVYLTGSHTWQNLQDSGRSNPPPKFDYERYLDFLEANNHNFFRLWTWEQARWSLDSPSDTYWFSPMPYQRVGPGLALDGLPKFDVTKFNQDYFDRLRERVVEAGNRGIYVSVMLFNGWSVVSDKGVPDGKSPWQGHPFNRANNINGIDGDLDGDSSGEETHQLVLPRVTAIQEAYIRKVIDTVNDLDNVLYEISNESDVNSTQWQYHFIKFVKNYEAEKPKHHPVGMTVEYPNGNNAVLVSSPADWISPNGDINKRPVAEGNKVLLADTDHLCGVCRDRQWVWKSFTSGENPILMDVYDGGFDLIVEQVPSNPLEYTPWVSIRQNLGYALTYANRINLVSMTPHPELTSSGYCLAIPVNSNAEYLVYSPSGNKVTVDLSAIQGEIQGEWFNPESGSVITGIRTSGGGKRSFMIPFNGDAVLYLKGRQERNS